MGRWIRTWRARPARWSLAGASALLLVAALLPCVPAAAATPSGPPVVTTTSLTPGRQGEPYEAQLRASGGAPPHTWSQDGGTLRARLGLSRAGVVSGVPTPAVGFAVRLTVTGAAGDVRLAVYAVPLAVTPVTLEGGTEGLPYAGQLGATGGAPPYKWSITAGGLPAGIALSPDGAMAGVPTVSGLFGFTAQVADADGHTAHEHLQLHLAPSPPVVNTATLPPATEGQPYQAQLQATGGTPPYIWTVVSGGLPEGLSLAPGGTIAGVPVLSGSFALTVAVQDTAAAGAQQSLQLQVAPAAAGAATESAAPPGSSPAPSGGTPPTAGGQSTGSGSGSSAAGLPATAPQGGSGQEPVAPPGPSGAVLAPLSVATAALPGGTQGQVYFWQLEASGGLAPFTWSVAGGGLPPGLGLWSGGAIGGTPGKTGTFSLTVSVGDAVGQTARAQLTLGIVPPSGQAARGSSGAAAHGQAAAPAAPAPAACQPGYRDVPPSLWVAPAVCALERAHVLSGSGLFRPGAPVTRGAFTAMLARALGLKPVTGGGPFADVPASDPQAPYIAAAARAGIVRGVTANTFEPDAGLTREEMAVALARALGLRGGGPLAFADAAQVSPWARAGVEAAVTAGYLRGLPGGRLQPLVPATRADAAQVLARLLGRSGPNGRPRG